MDSYKTHYIYKGRFFKCRVVPFYYVHFLRISFLIAIVGGKTVPPSIVVRSLFNSSFQYITVENGTDVLVLQSDECVHIFCEALYPVHWKVSGYLSSPVFVSILEINIAMASMPFYQISANLGHCLKPSPPNTKVSIKVTCETVNQSNIKTQLHVFANWDSSKTLIQASFLTVRDSNILPCATVEYQVPVSLRLIQKNKELVIPMNDSSIYFDPTQGYISDDVFEGEYICRQSSFFVQITALKSSTLKPHDFGFSPVLGLIRVFKQDIVQLKCFSKRGKHVTLQIDETRFNVSYEYSDSFQISVKISLRSESYDVFNVTGKAICIGNWKNMTVKIAEWMYEFLEPPVLILSSTERKATCWSKLFPMNLYSIPCLSRMECDYENSLFNSMRIVSHREDFQAGKVGICQRDDGNLNCATVSFVTSGSIVCVVAGLPMRWDISRALDSHYYLSSDHLSERLLINIEDVNETLYTNGTTRFFCKAHLYHFAANLIFALGYINGSVEFFPPDDGSLLLKDSNMRTRENGHVFAMLEIHVPIDAVQMHCIANCWSSSCQKIASTNVFVTKHAFSPKIIDRSIPQERFYRGEKFRRLLCNATGEPTPMHFWYFIDSNISMTTVSLGPTGESYLEFRDSIENKHAGEYKCVVKNKYGTAERSIFVTIADANLDPGNVAKISCLVIAIILVILFLLAIIIYKRRQLNAKPSRNLTSEEVENFFLGKPEVVGNKGSCNSENADCLPFNKDYEIPLADLEFGFAKRNILGSGEFAHVVRALILSTGKPVALKIPKPSTDINQFMSLLSEIKVMSFVGDHQNVVQLVGVCTEGIQIRSIYIATEICELGSLNSFLRKSRATFVNLISGNQDIDITLSPTNTCSNKVTTLDLISFSAQIAKGMEYLVYKSIVHADLAARNVLLTREKVVKISDFGLSRKLYDGGYFKKKSESSLPWRWMALECLKSLKFSTSSDVWAYGVTLYEIFSLGDVPFPNETWSDEFVERLNGGMRMGRPNYSTQEIFFKMSECWEKQPCHRPDFTCLRSFFEEMYDALNPNQISSQDTDNEDLAASPTSCGNPDSNYTSLYDKNGQ